MSVPNIKRNLEVGTIYIPLWHTGLITQRSPVFTPLSAMGMQTIERYDTLKGGVNMEVSLLSTLQRRPGFPIYCSQSFSSIQTPLAFYSFRDLSGNLFPIVDTGNAIYWFDTTTLHLLTNKSFGANQTSFQRVGNILYMTDGVDCLQWTSAGELVDVGIAVPTVAPTVTNAPGYLLPTAGWSYGYSFGNSNTTAVSTMSPATASVGDLNLKTVNETQVTCNVTEIDSVVIGDGPGTVTWSCPNNFSPGQTVQVSGSSPALNNNMRTSYVIETCTDAYWTASTAVWGPPYHGTPGRGFGQNCPFDDKNVTNCVTKLNPITIPGSSSSYTYTVVNSGAQFSAVNLFGGDNPATVVGVSPAKTYTQVASSGDVNATGLFFVNANGDFLFDASDTGLKISITYQIIPAGGAPTLSFVVTGPSSAVIDYPGSNDQDLPDTTGFLTCDTLTLYRTNDGDAKGGPWFLLALLPNNVGLVAASVDISGANTVYTFDKTVPAGANNGFATAPGTGGATITGFSNSVNNGTFDIVGSSDTSITCANSSGVNEAHSIATGFVNANSWTYTDTGSVFGYSLDTTAQDGELNILIEAPLDDENNPPPGPKNPLTPDATSTFNILCYSSGRLWGAVDNFVYFAGGPDVTYGSPEDSWPPANVFTFPGTVTALVSVNAGLLVFTDSDMFIIYGTNTATFYSNLYQKAFGVASQNCVVQDGDNLFIYTTKRQLFSFTESLQEIGFNIGDQLKANCPPSSSYLALHRNGSDAGLFISNGTDTLFKYRIDQQSWSTALQPVPGVKAIGSIEVTADNYYLLIGSPDGSGHILARDETGTIFEDSGATYPCSAIVGPLTVSAPGSSSVIESVLMELMAVGTLPTVGILLNEISGSFTTLINPVPDPPLLPATTSITSKRYYLRNANTPLPQQVRRATIQIVFTSENAKNEILSLGLA